MNGNISMKTGVTLVCMIALLNLMGCSGDDTEKKTSKPIQSSSPTPAKSEPVEPYPNSPTIQELQPDLHISGVDENHASGAVFSSEHLSGQ